MNLEIERRWLLKKVPNYLDDFETLVITQYYTTSGRYRKTSKPIVDGVPQKDVYHHTIKNHISEGICEEIEKEIDADTFKEAVKTSHKVLCKFRYVYKANGLKYEIDYLYVNRQDYVFLEIELTDINQSIVIPDFINDLIVKEITGDKTLSNFALATNV
jgi:CYTH domain-containing protein